MEHNINEVLYTLKRQYEVIDNLLAYRLENILPDIMSRTNLDMWIVAAREYNEDPAFLTLIPSLVRTASRLSYLVFYLNKGKRLECLSISRPNEILLRFYNCVWDGSSETQAECLKRIISERNPRSIGINISKDFALADGLTKTIYEELVTAIGEQYSKRLVSAEHLCIGWLEKRSAPELEEYSKIYSVSNKIIEEAFSDKVVKVGTSTTEDVEWWIMQKIADLGAEAWFTPTVDLQRRGIENKRNSKIVIMPGDILHCDVGIRYLGLCTDTQRVAYVLTPREISVPEGIKAALECCNHFQDIVTGNFIEGHTGNEILEASLTEAEHQGIKAMLYTHPIGLHGHGAGPIIGLWDKQLPISGKGDYPLHRNTCYALELNIAMNAQEWDEQEVAIFLEETIAFTEEGVSYFKDRQTEFIII